MGCGCSSKSKLSSVNTTEKIDNTIISRNNVVKVLFFILLVILSPVFLGIILWILFKAVVLDKGVDIVPLLRKLINEDYFRKTKEEDDDDDDEELDEDDVIAINVEDITNK